MIGYILVLLLTVWLVRTQIILPRQDRQLFNEVEARLDRAIDKLGDVESRKSKRCGRVQEKYGPGAMTCNIEILIPTSSDSLAAEQVFTAFELIGGFRPSSSADSETFRGFMYKDVACFVSKERKEYVARCNRRVTKPIY